MDNDLKSCINHLIELSEEDFTLLNTCISIQELKKGEILLSEGEVCRGFYLVKSGHLRTYYNKDGVPINLNFTFEGGFASNLNSFKHRSPSEVTIAAGEHSFIWVFSIRQLSDHFNTNPMFSKLMRRLAIQLLLASEEHNKLFKIFTPAERYHYIETHNPQLLQRISLSQMASYLGVSRETLSRIRARSH